MKILYISSSKIPSRTANSIHVMKMCHAWATAGHRVVLLTQHEKKQYEQNVANVYEFYGVNDNFKIIRLLSFSENLVLAHLYGLLCGAYALFFRPDIVYGRESSGVYWASFAGFSSVFEIHNPETMKGFYPKKLIRLKQLKYLVVISQKLQQAVAEMVQSKPIIVAHDGADAELKNDLLSKKNSVNFDFTRYKDCYNVGYTGHLYPGKGVETIIALAKKLPEITFHIFGGEEKDICRLKKDSPVNLIFHGFISQALVPLAQKEMDILLLPAQKKVVASGYQDLTTASNISDFMSPLKLFEYMRSGKPIIASDIPVLGEVLQNEINALLCKPDDIEQWEKAVLRLRGSDKLADKIADQARNDFIKSYSWQARSEKVLGRNNV